MSAVDSAVQSGWCASRNEQCSAVQCRTPPPLYGKCKRSKRKDDCTAKQTQEGEGRGAEEGDEMKEEEVDGFASLPLPRISCAAFAGAMGIGVCSC